MSHDKLSTTPTTQEDDDWNTPNITPDTSDWNDWPSMPEVGVDSPKRKGLTKRLGDKVASMTRRNAVEGDVVEANAQPSAEEYKVADEAVQAAERHLQAAQEALAERQEFFDSQKVAYFPGVTDSVPKSRLDYRQIEAARSFDSQRQEEKVTEAQNLLDAAKATRGEVSSRGWEVDALLTSPDVSHDQKNDW